MIVKRIVTNINTNDLSAAKYFYQDVLGLHLLMDHEWIVTYGSDYEMKVQVSFASQGGSDTPTPDLSIEVDDVDLAYEKMKDAGFQIEYGIVDEPWGVRRFYVRDPFGKLVNILAHVQQLFERMKAELASAERLQQNEEGEKYGKISMSLWRETVEWSCTE